MKKIDEYSLKPYHVEALSYFGKEMKRSDRSVCQGRSLRFLERLGLIQKAGIKKYWVITDYGVKIRSSVENFQIVVSNHTDLSQFVKRVPITHQCHDEIVGDITKEDIAFVCGRPIAHQAIYFLYRSGFSVRAIAEACIEVDKNITPHRVLVIRAQHLKIPPRTKTGDAAAKKELLDMLRAEGCSEDEIIQYFSRSGVVGNAG